MIYIFIFNLVQFFYIIILMPTTRKQKYTGKKRTFKKPTTHSTVIKSNEAKKTIFIKSLIVGKKYTEKFDPDFDKYKSKKEFKRIVESNPTLYIVNMIFYDCHKKSLFTELCDTKNKELTNALLYCFKLATIIKTKKESEKYPVIVQLCKHGFNTIYDIILENVNSFFLVSFVSHLSSEGVVKNPNQFITDLSKNKTYEMLRDKLVIKGLQLVDLFTRIKRYQ
jgi:hypothetical protein